MTRTRAQLAVVLALAVSTSCGGKLTEIVLVIDSDIPTPTMLDAVHIVVTGPSMTMPLDTIVPYTGSPPLTLSLIPRTAILQPVTITVEGERSGTVVVTRKIVTGFDEGVQRVLHVRLARSCVGGVCPTDQTCDERGLCVPTLLMSSSLPAWTGTVSVPELCNGFDDDGDGTPDNGFDLATDSAHCGMCSIACPAGELCQARACVASPVVKVSVGTLHACALRMGGGIACWGSNGSGELGAGDTNTYRAPVTVVGVTDAVDVSAGYGFSCAVRRAGQVICWGANEAGESGQPDTSVNVPVPTPVPGVANAVEVTTGDTHACARLMTGSVMCWGANTDGRLGAGTGAGMAPVMVSGLTTATTVHVGEGHACVARTDGHAACWGSNESGELGDGMATMPMPGTPLVVSGLNVPIATGAIAEGHIDAGNQFSCAITATGVACWGSNSSGRVGLPAGTSWDPTTAPVNVPGTSGATAVAIAGASVSGQEGCNACALLAGGHINCWGCNSLGELGDGTNVSRERAMPVSGALNAVQFDVGSHATCALAADASVWCWGDNSAGQLSNGTFTGSSTTPVRAMGL